MAADGSFVVRHGKAMGEGFRDGVPIGAGYFVVAFSLGIVARNAGLTPWEGFRVWRCRTGRLCACCCF